LIFWKVLSSITDFKAIEGFCQGLAWSFKYTVERSGAIERGGGFVGTYNPVPPSRTVRSRESALKQKTNLNGELMRIDKPMGTSAIVIV
jgi:hypothetical protein